MAHPEVREGSRGPPVGLDDPSRGSRGVGSPSSGSGIAREANPVVRKAHPEIRQGRVAHLEVWKVHPKVQEGSKYPLGGPVEV